MAFIALPGGAGTLEEIFEQWTWAQLGIHEKPCAFLNIKGYYDPLQAMVDNMVREGFMHPRYAEMLPFATSADEIIAGFRDYYAAGPKMGSAASYLNIKRRVNSARDDEQ